MSASHGRVLICNCFKTMSLESAADQLSGDLAAPVCTELCRGEIATFETAVAEGGPLVVACTQEAPLFMEVADERDAAADLKFVNIRETAGWTEHRGDPGAKILALLADAAGQSSMTPATVKEITSDGMCLVYGAGQTALDAALALEDTLSVTLVLNAWDDVLLPPVLPFPIYRGRLKQLTGSLGGFDVTLDDYAAMLPSSRGTPDFHLPRDGARASCSLVVDLSGADAPITAPGKRNGYFRAAPSDTVGVERIVREAGQMVGTFEKPIYVAYNADICAHEHAGKIGCSKCLDACPAGALGSADGKITVDTGICGGCGSCSATCPTGAIDYQYPARPDFMTRIQTLIGAYLDAGGDAPVLLIHEADHGMGLINALARFGKGLPPNVVPLSTHAVTSAGHDALVTAFLAGAHAVVVLADPKKTDELPPLEAEVSLTEALLSGLGHSAAGRIKLVATHDPEDLETALAETDAPRLLDAPIRYSPVGGKRDIARMAIATLHRASPGAPEIIELPERAPYGRIQVDTEGCTLCLACVSACPAGALLDNPDRPQVSFIESACVQCGLCQTTCPERVITLEPRFNTAAGAIRPVVIHEEEPAECVSCGKPFGSRSTIERIKSQLAGKHHMFQSEQQVRLIEMCDDCRIQAQWDADPTFASGAGDRPKPRTTEDYLDAESRGLSVDDFLKDN
ncbi:MAG: 4Fe-4S binding protein [Roseibium sp.]|nr:4Fe-4S binding protein [Roseibium sp.]